MPEHYPLPPSIYSFASFFTYYLVFPEKKESVLSDVRWEKIDDKHIIKTVSEPNRNLIYEEETVYALMSDETKLLDIRFYGVPNESYEYYDEEACNLLYQKIEEIKSIVKDLCIEAYNS